jgi:hypothetical protein
MPEDDALGERPANPARPAGVQRSMKPDSTRNAFRVALLFAALAAACACGPGSEARKPSPDSLPALDDEKVRETLFEARVEEVPEENGAAKPISWRFLRHEPTEVAIVERQMDGEKATVLVDVTARSAPRARSPKVLSGRLRLYYELKRVIFLRKWQIVAIDNISMKYREEPKPDMEPDDGDGPPKPPSPPPPSEPRTGPS